MGATVEPMAQSRARRSSSALEVTEKPETFRDLRSKAGLSQASLAELAGISRTTIWRIESGRDRNQKTDTLQALARAMRVPLVQLIQVLSGAAADADADV